MAFPRRLLGEREEVVLDLHPHWAYMGAPLAVALAVVSGVIALVVRVSSVPRWAMVVLVALLVGSVLWLAARFLRWVTTDLVVTSQRVVLRGGVVARTSREIPLDRIMNVSVSQTVPERLIGSGTLLIESGADALPGVFARVPSPAAVQSVVHREMENRSSPTVGPSALSIPEQIEKLDDLCRRGVITRSEFERNKARLLDRL